MRKLFTLLVAVLLTASVFAQSPEKMSYQAVIRNSSDVLVTNTQIGILQGSASGTAVYVETQTPTTNANGLVSIELGGGNFTHYIGEEYGGGVIFHLWKDNAGVEHGLIVALTDQSTSQAWSDVTSQLIGTSAQSSWDGLSNSNAIVGQAGHTSSAAKLCLDLVSGGQSDWYLPSIQELNMLWNNYYTVARALSQISGATQLTKTDYWSSSETSNRNAWNFLFLNGSTSGVSKNNSLYVRAVRAF